MTTKEQLQLIKELECANKRIERVMMELIRRDPNNRAIVFCRASHGYMEHAIKEIVSK